MKTIHGFDGDYDVYSRSNITHRKRDNKTEHFTSTLQISDFSDRRKVEDYLKEKGDK